MGTDKAFLRLGNSTLLDHAITVAKEVCDAVVLVGDRERLDPYGLVVEDVFPGRGPLAGIHAALSSGQAAELNLFLAVDLPGMPSRLLRCLLKLAKESGAVVTVPRANGYDQPLCAVYRREFLAVAEKSLQVGRNKIDPLFAEVSTRIVEEEEIKQLGFPSDIFDNVNTPADWDFMQKRLGASNHG